MNVRALFGLMTKNNQLTTKLPEAEQPKEDRAEMQQLYRLALADTGPNAHPEVVAAYMQAAATLTLAAEVRAVGLLLASGECGLTVAVEQPK